jgi:hypothetical protein
MKARFIASVMYLDTYLSRFIYESGTRNIVRNTYYILR